MNKLGPNKNFSAKDSEQATDEPFDRLEFLKNIRKEFLKKIGLPPDTKPDQVLKILELRQNLDNINKGRK
jgi:hypothetical protein